MKVATSDVQSQATGPGEPEGVARVHNAISVDVEDYFQVRSFAGIVPFSTWDSYERRFVQSTRTLLEIFEAFGVKSTFFVLGWNAEREPALVKEIVRAGHEIASHGWNHTLVYRQSRAEFKDDIVRTKCVLEDICGKRVAGYRAASYSITKQSVWALEVLAETGHLYDSSIYPIRRSVYGMPHERRTPHLKTVGSGQIAEFPMSTVRIGPWNVPFGSGAYFRVLPLGLTKFLITRHNRVGLPVLVSVHPWELDPDQPKVCAFLKRPNHYLRLAETQRKLASVLGSFQFGSIEDALRGMNLLPVMGVIEGRKSVPFVS